MKFLSHRGIWRAVEQKNTKNAFLTSFEFGFGVETDIRDCKGELVISHDPPTGVEQTLESFLDLLSGQVLPLALNIKSDGLFKRLAIEFQTRVELSEAFVFDMSVPDMIQYAKHGIPFFTRLSEYEREPALLDKAGGIWLDSFISEWFEFELIRKYIKMGFIIAIVSPELHNRNHINFWEKLRLESDLLSSDKVWLCTDFPIEASHFFEENL
jgi:hypothetical protein